MNSIKKELKFESNIHIYLSSVLIYMNTKVSSALIPMGPSKFVWQFKLLFCPCTNTDYDDNDDIVYSPIWIDNFFVVSDTGLCFYANMYL